MRRGSRRSFSGLLITAALHGAVFLAVKAAHSQPQGPIIVPRDFVQAEMVKLGKPRDKFWLPKVKTSPPPLSVLAPHRPAGDARLESSGGRLRVAEGPG